MLASQTLTPGAADAVSTGSTFGLLTQPVARAPVASDTSRTMPLLPSAVGNKVSTLISSCMLSKDTENAAVSNKAANCFLQLTS